MKKLKKILMLGTALTSVAAPAATVISFTNYENNSQLESLNSNQISNVTPKSVATRKTPSSTKEVVLDLSNYQEYTSYDQWTGTLTIKENVVEITDIFKNGYMLNPYNPNNTLPINTLILPSSLKKINNNAFDGIQLTTLTIPDGVTSIGRSAFYNSTLIELTLGNSIETIGDLAFFSADLSKLTIPSSVTDIGISTFYNSPLTSLTFADPKNASLKTIGDYAFSGQELTILTIPNGTTTIGLEAFGFPGSSPRGGYPSTLKQLFIPITVTSIGGGAFWNIYNGQTWGVTNVWMPNAYNNEDTLNNIFYGSSHYDNIHFHWL